MNRVGVPELMLLALLLFFVARAARRLWKGIPPRPLDPGAPELVQRVRSVTPWIELVWALLGFILYLVYKLGGPVT